MLVLWMRDKTSAFIGLAFWWRERRRVTGKQITSEAVCEWRKGNRVLRSQLGVGGELSFRYGGQKDIYSETRMRRRISVMCCVHLVRWGKSSTGHTVGAQYTVTVLWLQLAFLSSSSQGPSRPSPASSLLSAPPISPQSQEENKNVGKFHSFKKDAFPILSLPPPSSKPSHRSPVIFLLLTRQFY